MFLKTKWNNGEEIFSACALWMFHRFLSISFIYSHHTQQILSNFHYSFGYAFFAENLCICFTLSISLKRRWYSQITMDLKEDIQLVIIPSWNVSTLILVIILSYCVMSARRSKMYQNLLRRILNYVLQFCHPTTVCYGIMYTNNNLRGLFLNQNVCRFKLYLYVRLCLLYMAWFKILAICYSCKTAYMRFVGYKAINCNHLYDCINYCKQILKQPQCQHFSWALD